MRDSHIQMNKNELQMRVKLHPLKIYDLRFSIHLKEDIDSIIIYFTPHLPSTQKWNFKRECDVERINEELN